MNHKILIFIILLVLLVAGIFLIQTGKEEKLGGEEGKVQAGEIKLKSQVIETKAEGEIIHYFQESFYSEDDFSTILENKERFKSNQIELLEKELIGVSTENFEFNLDQAKKSVILKCDIRGASYATNSYDMHFLLGNWPFDLYQFKKEEKKLVYEGEIDGVPTKIVFEFPYSLSHCHEHVWPK
jgi:regulatory protein YycI of two-component signal transduction system YycFG